MFRPGGLVRGRMGGDGAAVERQGVGGTRRKYGQAAANQVGGKNVRNVVNVLGTVH